MWSLHPLDYDNIIGWAVDDHQAALNAFCMHNFKPKDEHYKNGALGINPLWFEKTIGEAVGFNGNARYFFEEKFIPFRLSNSNNQRGKVTGFYEPIVEASRQKTARFNVPLLCRPRDLIALDNANRPKEMASSYRFGRRHEDGRITHYFDRADIQNGALDENTLALAWLDDPVEAFFIHIQGAARLNMQDGSIMRVTYDAKNGHPFTAIGKYLVERGEIEQGATSMQSIKAWLRSHPDDALNLMEENQSYIFFKQASVNNEQKGPVAAAKIPLSTRRSLAVDRLLHTFSTPIFVNADYVNGESFNHLMIAQETGSAIIGPARGDIFFGSGNEAGECAGDINSECDFTLLIPRDADFDYKKVYCHG